MEERLYKMSQVNRIIRRYKAAEKAKDSNRMKTAKEEFSRVVYNKPKKEKK